MLNHFPSHRHAVFKWIQYCSIVLYSYPKLFIRLLLLNNTSAITGIWELFLYLQCTYDLCHSLHVTGINWSCTWPASNELVEGCPVLGGAHGSESHWSLRIFLGFICNCLSYFTTAKITFTCILYLQCTYSVYYDLYHVHI